MLPAAGAAAPANAATPEKTPYLLRIDIAAPREIPFATERLVATLTVTQLGVLERVPYLHAELLNANNETVVSWRRMTDELKAKPIPLRLEQDKPSPVAMDMRLDAALPAGEYTLAVTVRDAEGNVLGLPADSPDLPDVNKPDDLSDTTKPAPLVSRAPITILPPTAGQLHDRNGYNEAFALNITAPPVLPAGPCRLDATITITPLKPLPEKAWLVNDFTDDLLRVIAHDRQPVTFAAGKPATLTISLSLPELPVGQYVLNSTLVDAEGKRLGEDFPPMERVLTKALYAGTFHLPDSAVRTPVARMGRFNFDRELLWGTWDGHELSPVESEGVKQAGINLGHRGNYHFRYRWYVDENGFSSTGMFGEEAMEQPERANLLTGYQSQFHWMDHDPGFVLMDMLDELPWSRYDDARKHRLNQLIQWRLTPDWPGISTISKFNAALQTDYLGWDEALRDGFPQPKGAHTADLGWAFARYEREEVIGMRMEMLRQLNPYAQLTPGMGAGMMDYFYDSMHNRAYNNYSTMMIFGLFASGIPRYGVSPWTWLINLKPPYEQCSRITWASLAAGGRIFAIYSPGDGYGDLIVDSEGRLTPSGEILRQVHERIQPLAPLLLATRNQLTRDVLYWDPVWAGGENGVLEGLLACGVQPDVGVDPAGRKLIVAAKTSGGTDAPALRKAVEAGAVLLCVPAADPTLARSFGLSVPVTEAAPGNPAAKVSLVGLKDFFPGMTNVTVEGEYGPPGTLEAGSPLHPLIVDDHAAAWYGAVGKGKVLWLNVTPAFDRAGNGALLRALLDGAGVKEVYRFTDAAGRFHPEVLGADGRDAGSFPALHHRGDGGSRGCRGPLLCDGPLRAGGARSVRRTNARLAYG